MSKEIFESQADIWLIVHNEYGGKMGGEVLRRPSSHRNRVKSGTILMRSPLERNAWQLSLKHFFLEQAEGYVKALEKSTFRFSTTRGVFEHRAQNA